MHLVYVTTDMGNRVWIAFQTLTNEDHVDEHYFRPYDAANQAWGPDWIPCPEYLVTMVHQAIAADPELRPES